MDTPGGYDEHLCKMMSCLRNPIAPVYRARKYEFSDRDEWEALVRIQPRTATEPEYLFGPAIAATRWSQQSRRLLMRRFSNYMPSTERS
ncbi:hypothetical protein E2562_018778 [Oryza meyeriana var. granulata]|uniref:Uncharacterized protein n=1 Tax=Oryza meyeriana var. granulata TaxID=110450 RepID=A0A6G1EX91_9ORYZ|nr:hypothetical protein E2562_018778 [Oryza meyeriana var. granulata]